MERDKEEAKRLLQRCSVEVPEAAELCFLSDYITSEQGTASRRLEQLRRQGYPAYSGNGLLMMAADDNRRLDERIAAQPTVTGLVCATCFVDEKEAGYWMSGTLIGMTPGMLGILAASITPGLFSAPSAENRACKKVIKDIESDFIYYSKYLVTAAEPGFAEAGNAYERGQGVEKDEARALYWYEKAVAQGHPIAMFNLGWMYGMGNGVPQNIDRGVKLFRELLDRGDFRGKFSIGRCLVEGIGMDVDKEAGFKLIREAAPKYERARKYLEKHDPDRLENS